MSQSLLTQEDEVERNFRVFSAMLDDLMQQHAGRWALLRAGELIDVFDTIRDAHVAAWNLFPDDRFSVQEITKTPFDLGFYSHAHYHGAP